MTKQDKTAPKFPDLVNRDFTAGAPNRKWCGEVTEIPTADGKLYLATVIDLYSRRLLAAATSLRCDAELCEQAIKIAVAVRGGQTKINNVVFHTDRGSTYTARTFTKLCFELGVRQSMGVTVNQLEVSADGDFDGEPAVWLESATRADRRRGARKSCGASSATAK